MEIDYAADRPAAAHRIAAVVSGAGRAKHPSVLAKFRSELGMFGELDVTVVGSSAEATAAAREAATTAQLVVAIGGDGTVADVATGLCGSEAALAIVPVGSTNITARSLGIPRKAGQAISLLAGSHELRAIDVGRSDDRSFLHMAGAGIDAEMFRRTKQSWKRLAGWLAYVPPALGALALEASMVRFETERETFEFRTPLVLVANGGAVITPDVSIYPGISPDDGWLDLIVFTPPDPAALVSLLGRAGTRQLDRSPHVRRWKVKRVAIEADPPLPVQLDGDMRGETPREFALSTRALRVVVPRPEPRVREM